MSGLRAGYCRPRFFLVERVIPHKSNTPGITELVIPHLGHSLQNVRSVTIARPAYGAGDFGRPRSSGSQVRNSFDHETLGRARQQRQNRNRSRSWLGRRSRQGFASLATEGDQNRLLLCLVPPRSDAVRNLGPCFDRARNLTPGFPQSCLAV